MTGQENQTTLAIQEEEVVLRFLEDGKIKQLPVKNSYKQLVLQYLAEKFVIGQQYKEAQINEIIDDWHTFGDYFVLRRELVDYGLLCRTPNGSAYWRNCDENTNNIKA